MAIKCLKLGEEDRAKNIAAILSAGRWSRQLTAKWSTCSYSGKFCRGLLQ